MKSRPNTLSPLSVKQYVRIAYQHAEQQNWGQACEALTDANQALREQYASEELPADINRKLAKNYMKIGFWNGSKLKKYAIALHDFQLAEDHFAALTGPTTLDRINYLESQLYIAEIQGMFKQSIPLLDYTHKIIAHLETLSITEYNFLERAKIYSTLYQIYHSSKIQDQAISFLNNEFEMLQKSSDESPKRMQALIKNQLHYVTFYSERQQWPYMLDALHQAATIATKASTDIRDTMQTIFEYSKEVPMEQLDKDALKKLFSIHTMSIHYAKNKKQLEENFIVAIVLQHKTNDLLAKPVSAEALAENPVYDTSTLSKELTWRFSQTRFLYIGSEQMASIAPLPIAIMLFQIAKMIPYTLTQGLQQLVSDTEIDEIHAYRLTWISQLISLFVLKKIAGNITNAYYINAMRPLLGFEFADNEIIRVASHLVGRMKKPTTKINFDPHIWQMLRNNFIALQKGELSLLKNPVSCGALALICLMSDTSIIYGNSISPVIAASLLCLFKMEMQNHFAHLKLASQLNSLPTPKQIATYFKREQHRISASFQYLSALTQDCHQPLWELKCTYLNLQGNFFLSIGKFRSVPATHVRQIIKQVGASYGVIFAEAENEVALSVPGNVTPHPDVSEMNFEILNLLNQYHLLYVFSKQLDRIQIKLNTACPQQHIPQFEHETIPHTISSAQHTASTKLSHTAESFLTTAILQTIFPHATISLDAGKLYITGYEPGSVTEIKHLIMRARALYQRSLTSASTNLNHASTIPLSGREYAEFKSMPSNDHSATETCTTTVATSTMRILKKIIWPSASYDPNDANCTVYPVKSDHFPLGTCFITLDEKAFDKTTPAIREDFTRVAQEASHTDRGRGQSGIIYLNKEDKITRYRGNAFYANAKMKSLAKRTGDVRVFSRKEPEIAETGEKLDIFHKIITKAHRY